MAIAHPELAPPSARAVFGLAAGALLMLGAGFLWSTGDTAQLAWADAARASQDPTREVLIEGVLVPDREGPLFHSPASGEGALAYELSYYTAIKPSSSEKPRRTRVERQFAAMPLVVRVGDRTYQIAGTVTTLFTRDVQEHAFLTPKPWFPPRLRREFANQAFSVREARLEPGDAIAVRGRLANANSNTLIQRDGALELWDGGLAPYEKTRTQHRTGALALALAGLAAMLAPMFRRKPRDPYEGWKVFR